MLVASEDGLDQFFVDDPPALLERTAEAALIDHATPRILDGHVLAAAYEGPLTEADAAILGPEALERAAVLPEAETTAAGYVWRGRDTPAARVSLRSGDTEGFVIVDEETGAVLGPRNASARSRPCMQAPCTSTSATSTPSRCSTSCRGPRLCGPVAVDWYTQARKETETTIVEPLSTRLGCGGSEPTTDASPCRSRSWPTSERPSPTGA